MGNPDEDLAKSIFGGCAVIGGLIALAALVVAGLVATVIKVWW